jgi:hypothetical protein
MTFQALGGALSNRGRSGGGNALVFKPAPFELLPLDWF